jgi:hypothetical protein
MRLIIWPSKNITAGGCPDDLTVADALCCTYSQANAAHAIRSTETARFRHAAGWRSGVATGRSRATAGRVWRIGLLSAVSRSMYSSLYAGFQQGMHELGYIEGRNFCR